MLTTIEGAAYLLPGWEAAEIEGVRLDMPEVAQPIDGDPAGKNLLSMHQLSEEDIYAYLAEGRAAMRVVDDLRRPGIPLLPFVRLEAIMRQPSTRTGGSMAGAMEKLGGSAELISGMNASSEAKGESRSDSDIALATQADILALRTAEDYGPAFAAQAIAKARAAGKFLRTVPVINLGDGRVEHPTQALGDLLIMQKYLGDDEGRLAGRTIAIVGDHERYRAFHSLIIGAKTLGMHVVVVECAAAPVPQALVDMPGGSLERTGDLDAAMEVADALYMGRNPGEYKGRNRAERRRARRLAAAYRDWEVDDKRLQRMREDAISLHPRPRRNETHPSVDNNPRSKEVEQMDIMTPMRMAILARHTGASILEALEDNLVAAA